MRNVNKYFIKYWWANLQMCPDSLNRRREAVRWLHAHFHHFINIITSLIILNCSLRWPESFHVIMQFCIWFGPGSDWTRKHATEEDTYLTVWPGEGSHLENKTRNVKTKPPFRCLVDFIHPAQPSKSLLSVATSGTLLRDDLQGFSKMRFGPHGWNERTERSVRIQSPQAVRLLKAGRLSAAQAECRCALYTASLITQVCFF